MTKYYVVILLTLVISFFHHECKAQAPITFSLDTSSSCGTYAVGIYNIVGGTAPYTFSKDNVNFVSQPILYGFLLTTYTITVKDANNAVGTKVLDLSNIPPYPSFSIQVDSQKNASCFNICDGYIKLSAIGGIPPFTHSMSGQGNNNNGEFSNICASTYTITVADGNGCYATTTWNFFPGNNYVSASSTVTADNCAPGCNGSITIDTIYNVKSPYIAYLDGNIIAPHFTQGSLCSGYHSITIQDSIGCNFSPPDIFVPSNPDLILDSISNLQCGNFCSGYARVKTSGVTGTPTYSISPPGGNQVSPGIFTNLCSGSYKIFVQDSTSCIDSVFVYLYNSPKITFVKNINHDTCGIACNGSISINNIGGGVAPYTIIIGNDSIVGSSFKRDSLCFDNSYIVKVRDVEGCEIGNNGYYYKFSELQIITDSFTTQLCNNSCIGNITCNAVGNYGLVNYNLLPDSIINTNGTFNNLCAGSYTILAKDSAGCKSYKSYPIPNKSRPTMHVNLSTTENVSCSPGGDGIANYYISNATWPLQFKITPPAPHDIVNQKIYNLSQGFYYIEIVDSNNCYARDSTLIAKKQVGFVIAHAEDENCVPGHDGKLGFVPYSGTNNMIKIDINDTMTIYRNAGLNYSEIHPRGNYIVKIEDTSSKCIDSILLVIGFKNNLAINNLVTTNLKCFNDSSGSIRVNNFDSTYTYTILPLGQFNINSRTFENLPAGIYTITASTSENCTGSKLQLLEEPPKLNLTVKSISGTDLFCYGKIAVGAEFGTAPYTYYLAPPSGFQRVPDLFSELCIGQYTVSAIDSKGCIADSTVIIDQDVPDIDNIFENATILYNSITDDLTIDLPYYLDVSIEIYDVAGKKIYSESSYFKTKKIEMHSRIVGAYIIRIVADKIRRDFMVKKFMKN
ncbi:MAG: hypothetical protein IPJ31_09330 [Bacteroidetes bacterium]|nr:hypothetical protein [Bacteroidota bacterium]